MDHDTELVMRRRHVEERRAARVSQQPTAAMTKAEKLESLNKRKAHLLKLMQQLDDEYAELKRKP